MTHPADSVSPLALPDLEARVVQAGEDPAVWFPWAEKLLRKRRHEWGRGDYKGLLGRLNRAIEAHTKQTATRPASCIVSHDAPPINAETDDTAASLAWRDALKDMADTTQQLVAGHMDVVRVEDITRLCQQALACCEDADATAAQGGAFIEQLWAASDRVAGQWGLGV